MSKDGDGENAVAVVATRTKQQWTIRAAQDPRPRARRRTIVSGSLSRRTEGGFL